MSDQKAHLELDLTKYKTPELVSNLVSVISLPFSVKTVPLAAVLSCILALVVAYFAFHDRIEAPMQWVMIVATGVVAFFLGGGTAIVMLLNRAIGSSMGLMDTSIALSEQVTRDSAAVSDGTQLPPKPSQVVQAFYDQILMPTVLGYAGDIFLIGGIVVWFYKKTLGWLVSKVASLLVKQVEKKEAKKERDEEAGALSAQAIKERAERYVERLEKVRSKISKYGGRIRTFVIGPLITLLLFAAFILLGALGVAAWLLIAE